MNIGKEYNQKMTRVPVYAVEDINEYMEGFREPDKQAYNTSRETVKVGEKVVIKSGHKRLRERATADEILIECGKTIEQYEKGWPVVPQVAAVYDKTDDRYYAIELKGTPLKEKIVEASENYLKTGDISDFEGCIRPVGRLLKNGKERNMWWHGPVLEPEDAIILFQTGEGMEALATDVKSFFSHPSLLWVKALTKNASRMTYPNQVEKQKTLEQKLARIVENESGIKLEKP